MRAPFIYPSSDNKKENGGRLIQLQSNTIHFKIFLSELFFKIVYEDQLEV